jgi:DNA-binding LacI/PurR family transcriptional regulator
VFHLTLTHRAIAELGYHPNRGARNLRSRATRLLGYRVAPSPAGAINIVLDRFLHALTATANDQGYQLLLFSSPDGDEELEAYDELMRTRSVDGFVLSETNYGDPRVERLADHGAPFAVFGRTGSAAAHGWVDVDNADGTRQATEHLLASGRRRIAYLGWPTGSITGDERERGYREALVAAVVAVEERLHGRGVDAVETGRAVAERWLADDEPPDGVVAASDLLAIGVLHAAHDRGLTVGRDLAVTGFDDTPTAAFLTPSLTSVRQPLEAVAAEVTRQLIAAIGGVDATPVNRLLAPHLVVRASTQTMPGVNPAPSDRNARTPEPDDGS